MKLALALLIFILMDPMRSALPTRQVTFQKPQGFWSGTIEGKDDLRGKAEDYGLCGYALQTEPRNITVPNCDCKESFIRGESRWRCQPCVNTETTTTGMQATFCNFKNWNDQVVKTVSSNNSTNGKWMNTTSCTTSFYSSGIQPIFNSRYSSTSSIGSFNLQCSTLNLANEEVEGEQGSRIGQAKTNFNPTDVVTAFNIKTDPKGGITGFTSQYERR